MNYLLATLAGGLVVLSMVMNARLSRSTGVFQGVFLNYAVGLLASLLFVVVSAAFGDGLNLSGEAAPVHGYAFLGAFFGIAIVASCNVVIPKIAVVYSAVLIFLGQIVTGLVVDALLSGFFDLRKALGAALIAAGLLLNSWIDARSPARS